MESIIVDNYEDKKGTAEEYESITTDSAQVFELKIALAQLRNTLKALKLERKIARMERKVTRRLKRAAFWHKAGDAGNKAGGALFNFFADMGDRVLWRKEK